MTKKGAKATAGRGQEQQQIPFGNDKRKGKRKLQSKVKNNNNDKNNSRFPSGMTKKGGKG